MLNSTIILSTILVLLKLLNSAAPEEIPHIYLFIWKPWTSYFATLVAGYKLKLLSLFALRDPVKYNGTTHS